MLQGQVLSDKPPMFGGPPAMMSSPLATSGQRSTGAAAPSPSTATAAPADGSAGVQMEAHAARMRGLPLDVGPDMLVGLQDWSVTPVRHQFLAAPASCDALYVLCIPVLLFLLGHML